MSPVELRRLFRAARAVDTLPARAAALQARSDQAEAALRVALADGPVSLPGYRIALVGDRVNVESWPITDPAQLSLWRALMNATALREAV